MEEKLITEDNWEPGRVFINGQSLSGDYVLNSPDTAFNDLTQFQNNYNNFDPAALLNNPDIAKLLRKRIELESLEVENISILKLKTNKNGIGLDVHFKFTLDSNEYWGCFRKYDRDYECKFNSELTEMLDSSTLIKVIGILKSQLFVWFRPKAGFYKVIMQGVKLININGETKNIPMNAEIRVVKSFLDKRESVIEYNGEEYKLTEPHYYYFNYWFKKKQESPF
jgi:hypothetical protein